MLSHLYQLNTILTLSMPTADSRINPIFYSNNYRIQGIGNNIALDPVQYQRVIGSLQDINRGASPEVILGKDRKLLIVECKVNSFGPTTTQAHQARTYLLINGEYLSQFMGLPNPATWTSTLLYAVGGTSEMQMQETLDELTVHLRAIPITAIESNSVGMYIKADGLYLKKASATTLDTLHLDEVFPHDIKVIDDPDPRPIYLIPLDPDVDAHDTYGRKVLEERVRTSLAAAIGSQVGQGHLEINLNDILTNAVLVWDLLSGADTIKWFRNAVNAYVKSVLRQLSAIPVEIQIQQNTFTLSNITEAQATKIKATSLVQHLDPELLTSGAKLFS